MKIDRRAFLRAAMGMAAVPVVGACTTNPPPAQPDNKATGTGGNPCNPTQGGAVQPAPANECTEWDPSGECIGWADNSATMPANECTKWDPSGECIGWAGDATMPAHECNKWDPSGECIGWVGDSTAPANECVKWDPSGECIGWQ